MGDGDMSGFDMREIEFSPQEDITAYEAALALPLVLRIARRMMVGKVYDALAPNVQRHFRVIDHDDS